MSKSTRMKIRMKQAIVIMGIAQFIVLTTIAMFLYPGGNAVDASATHFEFWFNVFSDLGMLRNPRGQFNGICTILFNSAIFVLGACLIVYWCYFNDDSLDDQGTRRNL